MQVGDSEIAVLSFPVRVTLTDAEHAIFAALLAGKRNAEIARERGTALRTVANQVAALYRKLGVGSRSELIAFASFFGGTSPSDA